MDDKEREDIIRAAGDWVVAAGRDIDAYRALVRCRFLPFVKCRPREAHMAISHLQQATEKMVKALAIASGRFTHTELKYKYGHDSLALYADFIGKMIAVESVKGLMDTVEGKVRVESEAEIISHDKTYHILEDIKANIRKKGREIPAGYLEFGLLPEETMKAVLNGRLKNYNRIRFTRVFLRLFPDRLFKVDKEQVEKSMAVASSLLSKRGVLLHERIEEFASREEVQAHISKVDREGRFNPLKVFREITMPSFVVGELLLLSAFTFAHSIGPKYPGDRLDESDSMNMFNDMLYSSEIGVVRCVLKLGKLTELIFKEVGNAIPYTADLFEFFETLELSKIDSEGGMKLKDTKGSSLNVKRSDS